MEETPEKVVKKNEARSLGFVMVPMLVLFDNRLSMAQKILWGLLERYSGDDGRCFPGVKRIAQGAGLGDRMVQQHLSKLEELGFIKRRFRSGRSTEYEVQDVEDVYCNSDKQLLDHVLDMLRSCGENGFVEKLMERRESNQEQSNEEVSIQEEVTQISGLVLQRTETENGEVVIPIAKRRYEEVMGKANENQKKSDEVTARRKERHSKQNDDPYRRRKKTRGRVGEDGRAVLTTRDVEEEFRDAAREVWPDVPAMTAPWEDKHRKIAKRLCDRFGHELVIKVVRTVITEWDDYVDRFGFKGYPHMNILAKFADSWFPEIDGGRRIDPLPPRERARREREYDESSSRNGGISFIGD